ncbi:MAG TPA: NAD(P)H-dependent oxidoreductase [Candidatus Saccharimonadales bacterium]|jgi:putative NADPH-quinone reductase
MKTLIILNHPYEKSYCAAAAQAVIAGTQAGGKDADFLYLDKEGFNPVMTGPELLAWREGKALDPKVLEYQRRIKEADHLVFVFPIWWEAMPALTKGFIDKVIIKNFAYVEPPDKWRWENRIPNIKQVTLITGISTPKWAYKLWFSNAVYKIVLRGTFQKIGVKKVKWFNLDTSRNIAREKRERWLQDISKYFTTWSAK